MGLIAGAILGGSAIAAGGALGSAALSSGGKNYEMSSLPMWDPTAQGPLGVGQYWLSALLGFYDPSLLNQAGPLDAGLAKFRTTPYPSGAGRAGGERMAIRTEATKGYYAAYQRARDQGLSSSEAMDAMGPHLWTHMTRETSPYSGYNTTQEWFEAEYDHQQRINEIGELGEQLAGVSREAIANSINKMSEVIADVPGMSAGEIDELKAAELARLNQELDREVLTAQRRANVGGYNPGREIEEIERRRQDADTVALQRALAMIQGEQGVAANSLSLLQGGSNLYGNIALTGDLSGAANPISMGGTATNFNSRGREAGYISDAASTLGSGIGNAALAYGMSGSGSPAYGDHLAPSSYNALYGDYRFNMGNPLTG
jgi:hypothetical protein